MGNLIESGSNVLNITNGREIFPDRHVSIQVKKASTTQDGYLSQADFPQYSSVTTQFDKTDVTLANITGLTANLLAGKTYLFRAILHVSPDATGGHKYTISGTVTATSIIYQVNSINNSTNANIINSRQTALGGAIGIAAGTIVYTEIIGVIKVNTAGTLTVQFAQNVANLTSSILIGSAFSIQLIG